MSPSHGSPRQAMRTFWLLWGGQAVSLLGSRLVQFALIWHLAASTGSGRVLAAASAVALAPEILLGPVAGALVDRWPRRTVMLAADGGIALATLALAIWMSTGHSGVAFVLIVLALRAVGGAFHWPAMQATTSLLAPDEALARIAGLNQALQGLLQVAMPPLGALLLGLLGVSRILLLDVATAIPALLSLLLLAVPEPARRDAGPRPAGRASWRALWAELAAGVRYIRSVPGMLAISAVGAAITFFTYPGVALLPLMVSGRFSGGALELAWLQSTAGIGFVVGGLALSAWGGLRRKTVTAMLALMVDGVAIMALGLAPANGIGVALVAMAVSGLVEPFVGGPLLALHQTIVPPELQGRVLGLLRGASMAMSPLGLALAGPLADVFGPHLWFVIGGIVAAALGGLMLLNPVVRSLGESGAALTQAEALAEP